MQNLYSFRNYCQNMFRYESASRAKPFLNFQVPRSTSISGSCLSIHPFICPSVHLLVGWLIGWLVDLAVLIFGDFEVLCSIDSCFMNFLEKRACLGFIICAKDGGILGGWSWGPEILHIETIMKKKFSSSLIIYNILVIIVIVITASLTSKLSLWMSLLSSIL